MSQSISYTITKVNEDGESSLYRMQLTLNETANAPVQQNSINLVKVDADGTKTTESISMKPSSIATYSSSWQPAVGPAPADGAKVNGFVKGISTSSLAAGGVCYEIDGSITVSSTQPEEPEAS